ncbi:DMT family transporter [Arcobacteraceae bacterium]|jgi:drug/metabolite transporter (DMT)-like permease|nr:DMT family transporter [Arcobacteraceae bacterium]
MKSDQLAYKYALTAVFLWSTVATAFKFSLQYLSVTELLLIASITSFFVLLIVILIQKKSHLVYLHIKKHFALILLLGAINPLLYYLVLFQAYDLLPAQEAQAINYTWALMLSLLSVPFLKHKLTMPDIIASIICYFGVLVISTKGQPFSLNFSNTEGVLLALLSTVLWSLYWIFNTKLKVDSTVGIFSNFLFATPMIILYYIFTQPIILPETSGILSAMYVGLFEMGITFLFWLKAMQYTSNTSKIANLIFISPFLSLIYIYFILHEVIFISTLFGLTLIILGLIIQQRYNHKR